MTCGVKVQYHNNVLLIILSHRRVSKKNIKRNFFVFQKGPPEALGEIQFFPKSIFELKYYPYYGKARHVSESFISEEKNLLWHADTEITPVMSRPQVNYSAPVVAVRFSRLQYDTHIQVQCKLNGKGIINDSPTDRYLGSVTFSFDVGA